MTELNIVEPGVRVGQAAGARAIDVKAERLRAYNDWIVDARERFSWGVDSCNSYYRTPGGHTPFLFPGDFDTYKKLQDETGLEEFELA